MGKTYQTTAIAIQSELPSADGAGVPEWVHLLPTKSGLVQTNDSRGPYHVTDAEKIIAASFDGASKLPIDVNHATDLAAPKGLPAPARGWITRMQAREDGIWGQVEWTGKGRELLEDRAFAGISPVVALLQPAGREIVAIPRASLVNQPNLRGLTALNQESETMPFRETVAKLLGLAADASEEDITKALKARKPSEKSTELQSQLGQIGIALGCAEDAGAKDILTAAQSANADTTGKDAQIIALQSSLKGLSDEFSTLKEGNKKAAATSFVDGAIADMRMGVKPQRDTFITMHQENPERTEAMINGFPKVEGELLPDTPPGSGTSLALNATELAGKATAYQLQQAKAGFEISITEAVHAVQEGKA
ncbi:phage protease [Leisingera sp. M527]|uniref:phage protease n=1 Tax=Leisingera sp. M527 TaxID=2867014 RepID=UPI0021A82A61|nr:phage protease [Leisingera sp. M527]UWQ31333.1 phage protease [Leisingera sp. M527]